MNRLFFLLLLIPFFSYGQEKLSKAEINKYKKEAARQLEQLEKESPAMAEMMRRMMGENEDISSEKSKSRNPYLQKIILKKGTSIPTKVQPKEKLFWFSGEKLDRYTLVTTNGKLVQYQPEKKQLVIQPNPAKDKFSDIITELRKSEERRNEFVEAMGKSRTGIFSYPFAKQGLDGMDEADKNFSRSLSNVVEIPGTLRTNNFYQTNKTDSNHERPIPPQVLQMHKEIMQFVEAHKKESTFSISPPPEGEFDYCLECDSTRKKKQDIRDSLYIDAFFSKENEILQKVLTIQKAWLLNGEPKEWSALIGEERDVIDFLFRRLDKKCDMLLSNYGKDFKRLPVIVRIVLQQERNKQLMGVSTDGGSKLNQLVSLLDLSQQYIDEQIKNRNYKEVLNYRWILGLERQRLLLGGSEEGSFYTLIKKLQNFNRFKLTLEAKAKVVTGRDENGNISDWVEAGLTGSDIYCLIPGDDCRLRLVPEKRASWLMKRAVTEKDAYENTMFHLKILEAHSTEGTFAGPYEWSSAQPFFAGSFCHPRDTITIYDFGTYNSFEKIMAVQPVTENWNLPENGIRNYNLIGSAMDMAFPHEEIESEPAEPDDEAIIKSLTSGFSINKTLNDMRMQSNVLNLETAAFSAQSTGGMLMASHLINGSALIFESEMNGKENNPRANDVVYANMSVRLEHVPAK